MRVPITPCHEMNPDAPITVRTYEPILFLMDAYRNTVVLSKEQHHVLDEIERRMRALEKHRSRLTEINQELIRAAPNLSTAVDLETGELVVKTRAGETGIKLSDIGLPLDKVPQVRTSGEIHTYKAGAPIPRHLDDNQSLLIEMEDLINLYYYNAHKILKLVRRLPGAADFGCKEISVVRNQLLEHVGDEQPYNFGFGSGGPVVRPIRVHKIDNKARKNQSSDVKDGGLFHNSDAFIAALERIFAVGAR
jgi:hypothetical protein